MVTRTLEDESMRALFYAGHSHVEVLVLLSVRRIEFILDSPSAPEELKAELRPLAGAQATCECKKRYLCLYCVTISTFTYN